MVIVILAIQLHINSKFNKYNHHLQSINYVRITCHSHPSHTHTLENHLRSGWKYFIKIYATAEKRVECQILATIMSFYFIFVPFVLYNLLYQHILCRTTMVIMAIAGVCAIAGMYINPPKVGVLPLVHNFIYTSLKF